MRLIFATVLLTAAALAVNAEERFDFKIRNYFFAGFSGDAAQLEKGMKLCEEALAADPKNAPALVWHGSGLYYQSGQAFQSGDQQKGLELFNRSMKEMDEAVALAPDSVGVRIPRGAALLMGSRFAPPGIARPLVEKAVSDFEKTYELQTSNFDQFGTHPRGELMIGLAGGYSRLGDSDKARTWFERIKNELPGTPYEKSANLWLEGKTLTPEQSGCLGCHTGK